MLLRYFRQDIEPAHLALLRAIPLFADLKTHELATLDDVLHQRTYVKNEIIFDQDEEGQAVYFIVTGKVQISRHGMAEPLAEMDAGQFFGERALLEGSPRSAQVKAIEDCTIAVLFRDDFLGLMHTHPDIAASITEHCSLINALYRDIDTTAINPATLATHRDIPGPITWGCIIAATCLLLLIFKKILWLVLPFLLALMLYYSLAPIAKKMVQSGFSHRLAAVSLSGAFLLVIGIGLILFYPLAIAHAEKWQASLMHYLSGGVTLLEEIIHGLQHRFKFLQNSQFGNDLYQQFRDFSEHFSDKYIGSIALGVAAWLPSLLLAPIISFFLLKDAAYLRKMIGGAVPNAFFEKTLYLIHAVDRTARLYFVGLLKIAVIDTVLVSAGLWALGVSPAFLLGILVAVLCWIPYLGPLLGFAIVMMVAASDSPGNLPLFYSIIGLFITMRILDDFLFLPLIVGKSLRIHPLLTVMMFLIGEAIAGVAGLMLAIPILGVVMVLGETLEIILTDKRLQARHRFSQKLRWRSANRDLTQS
ncbi:AI-2E family transporter [Methylovorus sp. MM2]|uniref:AI-2E family transporter n=1 Tax=Methylovorus sp. MM2 TaxID=1848038 RepID=UPI0009EDF0CC|nr:AI-2E family transporter [Methylovorus sp. MM2]